MKLEQAMYETWQGFPGHLQNLARNFAASAAGLPDYGADMRASELLSTIFQRVSGIDRHTALRSLIMMVDAIETSPHMTKNSYPRVMTLQNFRDRLGFDQFAPLREADMLSQLLRHVAKTQETQRPLAFALRATTGKLASTMGGVEGMDAIIAAADSLADQYAPRPTRPVITLKKRSPA